MTAVSGIWNHAAATGNPLMDLKAMDSSTGTTGSSGSSSSDGSTISANDFLTLLVTEMQNQDPTAQTDPNEYINQLVQVNSLEQLVDINQNLSTALGDSSTTAGSSMSGRVANSQQASQVSGAGGPSSSVAPAGASATHGRTVAGCSEPVDDIRGCRHEDKLRQPQCSRCCASRAASCAGFERTQLEHLPRHFETAPTISTGS